MKRLKPRFRTAPARATQRGLTLIELMVSLLISLVLSLAIFAVLGSSEGMKRTTTSVNDINQSGNYAMYTIEKWVRSAGSGFTQSAPYAFGCTVFAAKGGAQVLPATAAIPAPFDSINTGTVGRFRLAPILIAPGQTTPAVSNEPSDALIVMSGAAGHAETAVDFADLSTSTQLTLANTVSYKANDIVLVADTQGVAGVASPCMVQQVSAAASAVWGKEIQIAGTYANATVGTASLTAAPLESVAIKLGNIAGNNPPNFMMIGVGANNTLFSYDLLQTTATPLLPIADGVFEMHALYGVDNDNNGTVDAWVDPNTTTTYTLAALMAGTETASNLLQSIKAVRVGLITRTSLPERTSVAPATLTLFDDLGLTHTRTLTTDERFYRYRTVESTIPIRNTMLLN